MLRNEKKANEKIEQTDAEKNATIKVIKVGCGSRLFETKSSRKTPDATQSPPEENPWTHQYTR